MGARNWSTFEKMAVRKQKKMDRDKVIHNLQLIPGNATFDKEAEIYRLVVPDYQEIRPSNAREAALVSLERISSASVVLKIRLKMGTIWQRNNEATEGVDLL